MCYAGKYQFSHKLICAECGSYYYRAGGKKESREGAVWKCSTFLKNGRTRKGANPKGCDGPNIRENQILNLLNKEAVEKQNPALGEEQILKELLELIKKALKPEENEKELKRLIKEQKKLTAQKDLLMEKLLTEVVSDQEFQRYHAQLTGKMEALNDKIESINQRNRKYNSDECRLTQIREAIQKENLIEKAWAGQILLDIDHILVYGDGRLELKFKEGRTVS